MIKILKKYNLIEIVFLIKKYYKFLLLVLFFSLVGSVITYILPLFNMKIIDDGIMCASYTKIIFFVSMYFILIVCKLILDIIVKK